MKFNFTVKVLSGLPSQIVHGLLCICPFQHQSPTVKMGTVAQRCERFLRVTYKNTKCSAFVSIRIYWWMIEKIPVDWPQQKVWTRRAGGTEARCTHLGILLSEEVNEAKTTVGSTDPLLWQPYCLELPERAGDKKKTSALTPFTKY